MVAHFDKQLNKGDKQVRISALRFTCFSLMLLVFPSTLYAQSKPKTPPVQVSNVEWKWEKSGREFARLTFHSKNTTKKNLVHLRYKVVCVNESGKVIYSAVQESATNPDIAGMAEVEQMVYLPWSEGEEIRRDSKQVTIDVE
jgi:hypothetical protein